MIECDVVLITVGRKPNTKGLNLNSIGVEIEEKKRDLVSDKINKFG